MGLPSFFRITVYFHTVYMNVHKISKRCAVGWDLLYLKVIVFPNVGSKKTAQYTAWSTCNQLDIMNLFLYTFYTTYTVALTSRLSSCAQPQFISSVSL